MHRPQVEESGHQAALAATVSRHCRGSMNSPAQIQMEKRRAGSFTILQVQLTQLSTGGPSCCRRAELFDLPRHHRLLLTSPLKGFRCSPPAILAG